MASPLEFAAFMESLVRRLPRFAPPMGTPKEAKATVDAWYPFFRDLARAELEALSATAVVKFEQFPSIRELLDLSGKAPRDDEQLAAEAASRIWGAIERFGFSPGMNLDKVKTAIGEVAWEVVREQGGWRSICYGADDYEKKTTLVAQWRKAAVAIMRKVRTGVALDAPPSFDALPPQAQKKLDALTARADVTPKDTTP